MKGEDPMNWGIRKCQQTSFNIVGEDQRWIATVYGRQHNQTLRMIQRAPEMFKLIKTMDCPEVKKLVKYIETGRQD